MAREIKIRIWDRQEKKMITFLEAYKHEDLCIDGDELKTNYDCIFPMQFTGLNDKNGKEIWEWDVF